MQKCLIYSHSANVIGRNIKYFSFFFFDVVHTVCVLHAFLLSVVQKKVVFLSILSVVSQLMKAHTPKRTVFVFLDATLVASQFTIEHALSCPRGGFPSICHNNIRNITASLMSKVCHRVRTEPSLQPMTREQLTH